MCRYNCNIVRYDLDYAHLARRLSRENRYFGAKTAEAIMIVGCLEG